MTRRDARTKDHILQRAKQLSRQLGASRGSAVRSGTTTAQRYQHGMLVSYGATGKRRTWLIHGKMMTKYVELGGIKGKLGRPIQDVRCSLLDSGCIQRFQGGTLYYSSAAPAVTVAYGPGRRRTSVSSSPCVPTARSSPSRATRRLRAASPTSVSSHSGPARRAGRCSTRRSTDRASLRRRLPAGDGATRPAGHVVPVTNYCLRPPAPVPSTSCHRSVDDACGRKRA